ncbi:MAG: hypothetical protein ABIR17_11090 [Pseudolysinimonas sp.]|uniref:hypothetical protein n=1 Tax=Pseudolysinimonas sp. TaxID=2680009 RepID=UPI0032665F89
MKVRTGASVIVGAVLATLLAGCSLFAIHQTLEHYDSSDGVSVTVGDVTFINAIVFTKNGQDGNFSAAAVNTGTSDLTVTLQYQSHGAKIDVTVDVPAGGTTTLGEGGLDGQVLLAGMDTPPGSLLKIYVQYGTVPGKQFDVPVLDASLGQYGSLIPSPTPSPTPTPTATLTPSPTPTP